MDSHPPRQYNLASKNLRREIAQQDMNSVGHSRPRKQSRMAKNFYQYTAPSGQILHGYQRRYKKHLIRKRGFLLKRDAEKDLRRAMDDIDATERGEIRSRPTSAQEAFDIYKRDQDIRGRFKSTNYKANN